MLEWKRRNKMDACVRGVDFYQRDFFFNKLFFIWPSERRLACLVCFIEGSSNRAISVIKSHGSKSLCKERFFSSLGLVRFSRRLDWSTTSLILSPIPFITNATSFKKPCWGMLAYSNLYVNNKLGRRFHTHDEERTMDTKVVRQVRHPTSCFSRQM